VQIARRGLGRAAPSFAALSAASFPRILKCPRT
jgi:hypothetical protein